MLWCLQGVQQSKLTNQPLDETPASQRCHLRCKAAFIRFIPVAFTSPSSASFQWYTKGWKVLKGFICSTSVLDFAVVTLEFAFVHKSCILKRVVFIIIYFLVTNTCIQMMEGNNEIKHRFCFNVISVLEYKPELLFQSSAYSCTSGHQQDSSKGVDTECFCMWCWHYCLPSLCGRSWRGNFPSRSKTLLLWRL